MKRFISLAFIFLMGFALVGCEKTDNGNGDPDVGDPGDGNGDVELSLQNAFDFISNKNHEIKVTLIYDNNVNVTEFILKFDDNKSMIKMGEDVEIYYLRDNRNLTAFEKTHQGFVVSTERDPIDENFLIFDNLLEDWYESKGGGKFTLKEEHLGDAAKLFVIGEGFEEMTGSEATVNEDELLTFIVFRFAPDRFHHRIEMEFTNYGTTNIELPEVEQ